MAEGGCGKWRRRRYRLVVMGLLLLSAGCTAGAGNGNSGGNSSSNSGSNRNSGFYGGMTGGGVDLR